MADTPDEFDTWLREPPQPLLPPPGAFEHIRRRARRRKARRAALAVLATAATVTVAVSVPQLIVAHEGSGPAIGPPPVATGPSAGPSATPSSSVSSSVSATPMPPGLPLPQDFQPTSVTFIGARRGWVLGRSTSTAGRCGTPNPSGCVWLATTGNYGRSWQATNAPAAAAARGDSGASQVRFLNFQDGWVFGPQLWATHDGGRGWTLIPTGGLRVTALETAGRRTFAVWARCTGSGADYAAHCTTFSLYSSAAGSNHWTQVRGATGLGSPGGPGAAELVLTSTRGYLLAPGGQLISGPRNANASWHPVAGGAAPSALPCATGPPQPDGQPSQALLAANGTGLALVCAGPPTANGAQHKAVYQSTDGGHTWVSTGTAPDPGTATSLAETPNGTLVLATTAGITFSPDGGVTWQPGQPAGSAIGPGGFSYVGMTFSLLGVAVPADTGQHALWFTRDGGRTWQVSRIP